MPALQDSEVKTMPGKKSVKIVPHFQRTDTDYKAVLGNVELAMNTNDRA